MRDPYLYPDVPVLKNKLGIKTEKTLDLIEAEQSRTNMMLLYEAGHLRLGREVPHHEHPESREVAGRSKRVVLQR